MNLVLLNIRGGGPRWGKWTTAQMVIYIMSFKGLLQSRVQYSQANVKLIGGSFKVFRLYSRFFSNAFALDDLGQPLLRAFSNFSVFDAFFFNKDTFKFKNGS